MKKILFVSVLVMTCLMLTNYVVPAKAVTTTKSTTTVQDGQVTIQGRVVDSNGIPLPGVLVYEKERPSNWVMTDLDGRFSITVTPPCTLCFSFVGFSTAEMPITGNQTFVEVTLNEIPIE